MILITRPRLLAIKTANKIKNMNYKALPMLHVRMIYKNVINKGFSAVIFTSQNAIYSVRHMDWIKNIDAYVVGSATYEALQRKMQIKNIFSSKNGEVSGLIELIKQNIKIGDKILYLRGENVAHDIKSVLNDYNVEEEIVYQTLRLEHLTKQGVDAITKHISSVLFYSKDTAEIFCRLMQKYSIQTASKSAICISPSVAKSAMQLQWNELKIADFPNEEAMLSLI